MSKPNHMTSSSHMMFDGWVMDGTESGKRFSYQKCHARHRFLFFQITENKVKFNAFPKRSRWDVCRSWWTFYNERKLFTNATTDDYVPTQQGRTTENALYTSTLFLYENVVFPAQAEYSYFSADFRLKIFLNYS